MDLHIHSIYSDGSSDVQEILEMAEKRNIEVISITDHDTTDAYEELDKKYIRNIYNGKIISGIEVTTSFKKHRIELLAYGFDNISEVGAYFKEKNDIEWIPIYINARKNLLKIFDDLNIKYDKNFNDIELIIGDKFFETHLYASCMELNDNLKYILKDEFCENEKDFFRKCVTNPHSKFFIDFSGYRANLIDSIKFLHKNGAKVFLSHPYKYLLNNLNEFLNILIAELNKYDEKLDGIEIYNYDTNSEDELFLLEFAKTNNLLISGGSEYHNYEDDNAKLGFHLYGQEKIKDETCKW